jgi:hypothetical protein
MLLWPIEQPIRQHDAKLSLLSAVHRTENKKKPQSKSILTFAAAPFYNYQSVIFPRL